MKINKFLLATKNKNKLREIREILRINIPIISLLEISPQIEIEENGETFRENAFIKASTCFRKFKIPSISDDSGLEIDALNGKPGIHSARFAPTNKERIEKVLNLLKDIPFEKRTARFRCAVCLFISENEHYFFEGKIEGYIAFEPKGNNGFGYDPIFYLPEYKKTLAQLPLSEKNKISHRFKAFSKLAEFLHKYLK